MDQGKVVRDQVLYLLRGGGAHVGFDEAVAGLTMELLGAKPKGIPHSIWELVEHMRLAQEDILDNVLSLIRINMKARCHEGKKLLVVKCIVISNYSLFSYCIVHDGQNSVGLVEDSSTS